MAYKPKTKHFCDHHKKEEVCRTCETSLDTSRHDCSEMKRDPSTDKINKELREMFN